MKINALTVLKLLMWIVAGMHLVVGCGLGITPGFARYMANVYAAEVKWTPEFSYIVRPMGVFMISLGIMAIAAARDPIRYRAVLYALAVVFLARAAQRLVWADEVQAAFGLSSSRNIANMLFFTFIGGSIIVLDILSRRKRKQDSAPATTS